MAQWRKVVVSGSSPEFNGVTLSGDLTVSGGDIVLGSTSIFSGGNTAQLNNIDALDATTEATIESAIDTLSNLTAASSLVTVSTLSSGAISSGFGNIDIGTSTLNAGNTTVDTLVNDSSVAASRITGSFTGSFSGDGSNLSGVAQDINSLGALGGASLHQTQDHFLVSDNGTEKKVTFSNLEDSIFANVSGDIAIAAGGAATIQANSVALGTDTTGNYVATITGGTSITSTAATSGEGTTHSLSVDDVFVRNDGNDSSSGTITAGGFTSTATGSIAHIKASDEISGSISQAIQTGITTAANLTTVGTIGSGTWAATDVAVTHGGTGASNASTARTNLGVAIGSDVQAYDAQLDSVAGWSAAQVTTLGNIGTTTTAADKMIYTTAADTFAETAITAFGRSLVDDAAASNARTTLGLGTSAVLSTAAIADGGAGVATADQIHTFYTAGGSNLATALNTDLGGDFTIGNQSSDTATFSGAVTITGNLDVNGTLTTIDSTNLRVADRFIYASSGSTSGDGGLIVGTGADGVGTALGYDDSASRWALTKADDTAEDATSITPRQYVVSVSGSAADASSNPSDFGSSATDRIGMMHVNTSTGDIFIFS